MRRALRLDELASVVHSCRAHEIGEVEIVWQPVEADRKVTLQLVGEVLRQIGVGAFEIGINRDGARLGHSADSSVGFRDSAPRRRWSNLFLARLYGLWFSPYQCHWAEAAFRLWCILHDKVGPSASATVDTSARIRGRLMPVNASQQSR